MYDQLVAAGVVKSPREMLDAIMDLEMGPKSLNDLVKRIGMTPEEIFEKFPALEDLQARHVYDADKCDYRKFHVYDDYSEDITFKTKQI